jgi:hypothetical protein
MPIGTGRGFFRGPGGSFPAPLARGKESRTRFAISSAGEGLVGTDE